MPQMAVAKRDRMHATESSDNISKGPNLLVDLDRLSTTWEANKSPKRGAYGLWLCPPK